MEARPMVTAGFKWAPLKAPTAYTATATPNPQPAVMTIHPAFCPLVLLSTTLATTPSPRMISSMVPSSSARKGGIGSNGKPRRYQRESHLSTRSASSSAAVTVDTALTCPPQDSGCYARRARLRSEYAPDADDRRGVAQREYPEPANGVGPRRACRPEAAGRAPWQRHHQPRLADR